MPFALPRTTKLTPALVPRFRMRSSAEPSLSESIANGRILNLLAPNPLRSTVTLISTPLGLLVLWLVYGLLAYLYGRLLGGRGTIAQTYGCVALATSAQALRLANALPYVHVGGVVTVWGLLCNFVALKAAHKLSGGRAFWATVLPIVTIWLVALLLLVGIALAFGSIMSGIMDQLEVMGGLL